MEGLKPETWPVLLAFLVLQTLITLPLIRYIRTTHEAQIALLQKLYDQAQAERAALLKQVEETTQRIWKFTDVIESLREAVKDLARERRAP
jgi:predicted  nucleic acid-binding Zn-ribbon protein